MVQNELTADSIKAATGKYDVESVFSLTVVNAGLTGLGDIEHCVNLLDLDVHNNEILDMTPVRACTKLERVNISGNIAESLEPFRGLSSLAYIHIQGNQIRSLDQLECLGTLPNLKAVYFQNIDGSRANPVCSEPGYREKILSLCPGLDILDGQRLRLSNDFYKLTTSNPPTSEGAFAINPAKPIIVPVPKQGDRIDKSFLDEVCKEVQDELDSCKGLLAEVDTFLRLRGIQTVKRNNTDSEDGDRNTK
ncbi:unnamed protein product (mitochondrion) [Plasmodiophora brassicae]|uniref:U2A'/phosphoprotein 32 family A C-terminal domain-containing protein n=1 Tax=Plasmodiophora brassicae TaxID=37360 RepID=A0A0G4J571_PLABS|nr:hypothetical protein PBRA_002715 [Plasmodiophora brassicae]SPQ94868.1 unnamed protein product [Plasmodiophora brassicae]